MYPVKIEIITCNMFEMTMYGDYLFVYKCLSESTFTATALYYLASLPFSVVPSKSNRDVAHSLMLNKLPKEVLEIVCLHLKDIEYQKLRIASSSPRLDLIQVESFQIFKTQGFYTHRFRKTLTTCSLEFLNDDMLIHFAKFQREAEFRRSLRLIYNIPQSAAMEVFLFLANELDTVRGRDMWVALFFKMGTCQLGLNHLG